MICDECEESQAFPKDIVELESTLGIPRDELTAEMEKGKRCIACGSILKEKVPAVPIKRKWRILSFRSMPWDRALDWANVEILF